MTIIKNFEAMISIYTRILDQEIPESEKLCITLHLRHLHEALGKLKIEQKNCENAYFSELKEQGLS